jgi:hypothetical protein
LADATSKKAGKAATAARKGGKLPVVLWLLAMIPIGLVLWPTMMLAGPLMFPTLVALLSELRKDKYLTASVGATNFCGVVPSVVELWDMGHDGALASQMLSDDLSWGMAFSGAAIGFLIYSIAEWFVSGYYRFTAADRLKKLSQRQQELLDAWGPDVVIPQAAAYSAEPVAGHVELIEQTSTTENDAP